MLAFYIYVAKVSLSETHKKKVKAFSEMEDAENWIYKMLNGGFDIGTIHKGNTEVFSVVDQTATAVTW
jgi:hypothetical protein